MAYFNLILILLINCQFIYNLPLNEGPIENTTTDFSNFDSNLNNLEDSKKLEYLEFMNHYLNEKLNKLTKNELNLTSTNDTSQMISSINDTFQMISSINDTSKTNTSINDTPQTIISTTKLAKSNNQLINNQTNQLPLLDRIIIGLWSLEEIIKLKLSKLEDDYAKNIYKKANQFKNQLKREDICVPFILGLLSGLLLLIILNLLKFCLKCLCCKRRYSLNRRKFIDNFNKRNPLDETHHLLVDHNLYEQEI